MKAISIRQPWAWLIVNGYKDIENRTWATSYRGPVLIHASKQWDIHPREWSDAFPGIEIPHDIQRGGIVGTAEIAAVVTESESRWFTGPKGWELRDARPVAFHPCNGRLGLFELNYSLS